jgi:hypothetical protein
MGDSVLRNGAIKVGVFRNVALDKVNLRELILAQDGPQTLEAGIDVKNIGRVTAFQQSFGNPCANEAFGACNKEAFLWS